MIDAGQATEYLTSMIKGFKLEVSDAVNVVSKLTAVDMEAASSAGDIAAALQNVATTAQLAGVSLDETIAYATTIIETTQRDASSVGMALRTIMSRYGNVKAGAYTKMNLEASSDTDLENLNDIEKVLGKIGISIRSTNTEFRSFSDVLEELSDRWVNLDNVSKNAIATAMAGVRQREQFLVLMENMDRAEELEEISATSQGTAQQKYTAYMETIESARNRLSNAWSEMAQRLEDSGVVKFFTDVAVVITQHLLPALNAFTAFLISYNGFKLPTVIGNVSKKIWSVTPRFGDGRDDLYRQMINWQDQNKLEKDPITGKYHTKKSGFLAQYVDKQLGEDFTQSSNSLNEFASTVDNATGSVKKLVEQNQESAEANKDLEKNQLEHAKAVEADKKQTLVATQSEEQETQANQRATQSEEQETQANQQSAQSEYDKAQNKLALKQGASSSVKGAYAGIGLSALISGVTTGMSTEGSTKAKATTGTVSGTATAIAGGVGFAIAGPLGAAIGSSLGSMLGSIIAPKIAEALDKAELARKDRVETASKQLTALKAQTKSLQEIVSYSKQDNLTSEDITTIKDYVAEIRDNVAAGDSVTFRTNLEGLIDTQLLQSLGYTQFEDLYRNLEDVLTDETKSQEDKQKLTEAMNVANIQAERDAYYRSMEEKRYSGMSYDEQLSYEKKLQKYDIEAAYYKSGIENLSTQALGKMGIEGAAKQVAAKLYGIDSTTDEGKKQLENLVVSNDLLRQITSLMKHSQSNSVQNLMAGQVYTLKDVVDNVFNLSAEVRDEQLKKFASSLGISVENVANSVDAFGTLTLGDLSSSFADLKEATDQLINRFDKLSTEGSLDLEDLFAIAKSSTGEASALGLGEAFGYAQRIQQVAKVMGENTRKEWLDNPEVWNAFTKDAVWGENGFDENESANKVFKNVKSYAVAYENILIEMEAIKEQIADPKVDDTHKAKLTDEYNELVDIYNKMIDHETNFQNKVNEAVADYERQILLGSVQSHLEHRLDREISALNEQKSALEQINNQREYENKLIEAKIKLENAQNEKKKVWREGVGWVYEADTTAIADAQKALEDLDNTKKVNELQTQINELQAQKDWMADFLDDRKFEKAQKFMESWQTNITDTVDMISKWQNEWNTLESQTPGDTKDKHLQQANLARENAREQLKKAHDELLNTDAYKLIQSEKEAGKSDEEIRHSLTGLTAEQRDQWASARHNYEQALNSKNLQNDDISGGEGSVTNSDTATMVKNLKDATPGYGRQIFKTGVNEGADNYLFTVTDRPANEQLISAHWKNWLGVPYIWFMDQHGEWKVVSGFGGKFSGIKSKYTNRLMWDNNNKIPFYIGSDQRLYAVEKTYPRQTDERPTIQDWNNSFLGYADGTLSTAGGPAFINDDPQYGLEGIITPQGTLTALPSKSGVVPADLTRNVWQLGEVAPNLIKQLVDINGKFSHTTGFGTDESFNVEHLDVHMVAQPGFDMDDFVRQLQAARNLTRHS